MTDEPNVGANDTSLASDSRTIDDSASTNALGRGVHLPEGEQKPEEHKPISTRDAIAKAFDDNMRVVEEKAKGAVDQAKVKLEEAEAKPVKAEQPRAEGGKFAKAETQVDAKADKGAAEQPASERAAPVDRESETRRHQEPPARFLPEAREKWANVPSNIKAEFHRVTQEMEAETTKYRQSHEAYEAVRQFDEQAKASGTDLKTALQSYTNIENLLRSNPARGVAEVLRNIGLTPEQYAQHVMQNPHAHQFQQQPQQQAPQQQSNPEIEALRNEIHSMKAQAIIPVIDRFIDEHPDYHALENQIEAILKSGVIEQIYGSGLSPEQKLAQSYRMAGGRAPSQSVAQQEHPAPIQNQAAARPVDLDGQKSIKGAPTNGQSTEPAKRFKSNRAALEEAFNAFGGR